MKTTPEELIKEALAVRDDGKEPKHKANEYESALLHVARSVITSDEANALIFAADRARARDELGHAAPVEKVMKSSSIALDAEQVRKSGSSPRYTRDDYHNEMVALSKKLLRPGETPAVAFGRLVNEGAFDDLYAAGERAEATEVEAAMSKAAPEDKFYPLLLDLASMRRAPGETLEKCMDRLLTTDRTVMDAYAASQGL